jgi:uncharacterized membrane protein YkoI
MNMRSFPTALMAGLVMILASAPAAAASLESIIEEAELTFAATVYDADLYRGFAEVELLSNDGLIEAVFDRETGQLIESELYGTPRRTQRVARAVERAELSILDAIAAATAAVGPGDVLEADLIVSGRRSGRVFMVDVRTAEGDFDVAVSARNGRILRVISD